MAVLTRLLIWMAVAVLVAQPAMACCLAVQNIPAAEPVHDDVPPCHSERSSTAQPAAASPPQRLPLAPCPGCLDCDSVVAPVQPDDPATLPTQSTPEITVAFLIDGFPGFEQQHIAFKTGPPGAPPIARSTPITLKERLLI